MSYWAEEEDGEFGAEFAELHQDEESLEEPPAEISLCSVVGLTNPKTLKLRGPSTVVEWW